MELDLTLTWNSFSFVGNKTCVLTDKFRSAFRFTDTGGIFGNSRDENLSGTEFLDALSLLGVGYASGGATMELHGAVQLRGGEVAFKTDRPTDFLDMLRASCRDRPFPRMYLPVQVRGAAGAKLATLVKADGIRDVWKPFADLIILNTSTRGIVPMAFDKEAGKLRAHVLFGPHGEIPLPETALTYLDEKIHCVRRFLIGNAEVAGLTISYPDSAAAAYAAELLGAAAAESATTVPESAGVLHSQTSIRGIVDGKSVHFDADAGLDKGGLTFRSPELPGGLLEFSFRSEDVGIAGTCGTFVISSSPSTTLVVKAANDAFHRLLTANPALSNAADRTSNDGPFLTILEDEPARVDIAPSGLQMLWKSKCEMLDVSSVEWGVPDEHQMIQVRVGNRTMSGPLSMMEGLCAHARAYAMAAQTRENLEGALASMVGQESQYFLYSVFGGLAYTHLSICESLGADPDCELTPTTEREQEEFVWTLFAAVPRLLRSFDAVPHYMPGFCFAMDERLLRKAGLQVSLARDRIEACVFSAVSGAFSVASKLARMQASLARLGALREASKADDGWGKYLPLGLSAAAGMVNPLMLVGAAQQGLSLYRSAHVAQGAAAGVFREALDVCISEWNFLMQILLPGVMHKFLNALYPTRLNVSALLMAAARNANTADPESLASALSLRRARLDVFAGFPLDSQGRTRAHCLSFLNHHLASGNPLGLRYI